MYRQTKKARYMYKDVFYYMLLLVKKNFSHGLYVNTFILNSKEVFGAFWYHVKDCMYMYM